jgi:hypothetical protein
VSLTVPPALLEKARHGAVDGPEFDAEFLACIRESLPYAWGMVQRLADELEATGAPCAQNTEVPPDDAAWGQVFRLVGSDAMRGAVQRHFGVRLAFQNCCRIGLFRPGADEEYERFVSPRAQLLNQRPELLNC